MVRAFQPCEDVAVETHIPETPESTQSASGVPATRRRFTLALRPP
jgi:hypothetical protein